MGFADTTNAERRDRTIRKQGSVLGGGSASLKVTYTDKPVSGWGGLVAVVKYMADRKDVDRQG